MKTSLYRLISLLSVIAPMVAIAQTNIRSAFDAIINCPEAKISESHKLEKDPTTKVKEGQCDIYRFELPSNKINLVKNVISAFDKDSEMAYSVNSGKALATDSRILLSVGDGSSTGVYINEPDHEYIYALFLPSTTEDPDGIHRYAYEMDYKEEDGKLIGKLVITYSTTLKYRQQIAQENQLKRFNSNFQNGSIIIHTNSSTSQSWFEKLMSYFQSMTSANTQTRIALATKAYKLIREEQIDGKAARPDAADKEAVREILKDMISDRKYSESVLNSLLNQCLIALK